MPSRYMAGAGRSRYHGAHMGGPRQRPRVLVAPDRGLALEQQSDSDLAARLLTSPNTEPGAAEELCRRFAPRIRLFGLRYLRDQEAANDLVQEVLLVFLEAARDGRLRDPGQVASFVLGTCRHLVWNTRRTYERRQRVLERHGFELLPFRETSYVNVNLDLDGLMTCWSTLSQRERQVLFLTFQEELASEVIGQRLGMTAANVRVVRHRVLGRLRDCLELGADTAMADSKHT